MQHVLGKDYVGRVLDPSAAPAVVMRNVLGKVHVMVLIAPPPLGLRLNSIAATAGQRVVRHPKVIDTAVDRDAVRVLIVGRVEIAEVEHRAVARDHVRQGLRAAVIGLGSWDSCGSPLRIQHAGP